MSGKMSAMYFVCVLRYEIEEGLNRLRAVKPAGETFMHEGIKEVSLPSQVKYLQLTSFLQTFTREIIMKLRFDKNVCLSFLNLKARAQIQTQKDRSSSIILALTDGKLEVFIHDLTVGEVRFISTNSCTSS